MIRSATQQSEKSPAKTRAEWENTSASARSWTWPSARFLSRSTRTISGAVPEMSNAYAVVEPTKPVPTIATRATRFDRLTCGGSHSTQPENEKGLALGLLVGLLIL